MTNPMRYLTLALILLTAAFAPTFAQTEDSDTIRVETSLVSVPVVVSDRQGRYLPGLKRDEFQLWSDGKPREIAFFATAEEPLRVAILLDTSRSTEGVLGNIKKAAKEFIKVLSPNDSAMIVSFDYDVHINSPLTSDKKQLERAIKDVEIGEMTGTVMRDAVIDTVSKHLSKSTGRKAIIMLTDGKDFGSYALESEVLRRIEESDVMIYPIFYETSFLQQRMMMRNRRLGGGRMGGNFPRFPRQDDRRRRRDEAQNERALSYLQKLADLSAGTLFEKKDNDLDEVFLNIAQELRQQYRLGFYPDEGLDDSSIHEIKVRVSRPDVSVRSRYSYRVKK